MTQDCPIASSFLASGPRSIGAVNFSRKNDLACAALLAGGNFQGIGAPFEGALAGNKPARVPTIRESSPK